MKKLVFYLIFSLAGLAGLEKAEAQQIQGLFVCNSSYETADAVIGYLTTKKTWATRGWFSVRPGACKRVLNYVVPKRDYYVYAKGTRGSTWGSTRGKGYNLCVKRGSAFNIEGTKNCRSRGYSTALFKKLTVSSNSKYKKWTLTSGKMDKIDSLDVGDGVYVEGLFSDELGVVTRIDKRSRKVKVRRRSDGTTIWVGVNKVITREQSQSNNGARAVIGVAALLCAMAPDNCKR